MLVVLRSDCAGTTSLEGHGPSPHPTRRRADQLTIPTKSEDPYRQGRLGRLSFADEASPDDQRGKSNVVITVRPHANCRAGFLFLAPVGCAARGVGADRVGNRARRLRRPHRSTSPGGLPARSSLSGVPVNAASSVAMNLLHGDHRHLFPRLGNGPRRGYRAEPTADRPSMCQASRHAEVTAPRNQDVVVCELPNCLAHCNWSGISNR